MSDIEIRVEKVIKDFPKIWRDSENAEYECFTNEAAEWFIENFKTIRKALAVYAAFQDAKEALEKGALVSNGTIAACLEAAELGDTDAIHAMLHGIKHPDTIRKLLEAGV